MTEVVSRWNLSLRMGVKSAMLKTASLLLSVLALFGCSAIGGPTPAGSPTPSPSPTVGPIAHATGASDVILRMEVGGGFVPFDFILTQAPDFTLYGDGTVIYKQTDTRMGMPMGGLPLLPWLVGHMPEADVQTLLAFALGPGGLADAAALYNAVRVMDAPSTIFTIHAGGFDKTVNVNALGMEDPTDPDAAIRARLQQLATALTSFEARGQQGELGTVTTYDAAFYRVTLLEGMGEPQIAPIAWPWADLTPDDFVISAPNGNGREKVLDRAHAALLLAVPNGGMATVWVSRDGTNYDFAIRPLLPDELLVVSPAAS